MKTRDGIAAVLLMVVVWTFGCNNTTRADVENPTFKETLSYIMFGNTELDRIKIGKTHGAPLDNTVSIDSISEEECSSVAKQEIFKRGPKGWARIDYFITVNWNNVIGYKVGFKPTLNGPVSVIELTGASDRPVAETRELNPIDTSKSVQPPQLRAYFTFPTHASDDARVRRALGYLYREYCSLRKSAF